MCLLEPCGFGKLLLIILLPLLFGILVDGLPAVCNPALGVSFPLYKLYSCKNGISFSSYLMSWGTRWAQGRGVPISLPLFASVLWKTAFLCHLGAGLDFTAMMNCSFESTLSILVCQNTDEPSPKQHKVGTVNCTKFAQGWIMGLLEIGI